MTVWSFVDERKVLEDFLKNKKDINNNTYQKLIVFIKYLKENKYNKVSIRSELDNLMNTYYKGFVMADWEKTLIKLINKYTRLEYRSFRKLQDINITRKELKFIKEFEDIEIEKLLFVMLALSKSYPYKYGEKEREFWVNFDSNVMFKLSKYKYNKNISRFEQREYLIYDIAKKTFKDVDKDGNTIEKNVIKINKVCDSISIKLMYADNITDKDGINIEINDNIMDDLTLYYLRWRGEKVKSCEICGKLILVTSKKTPKYCTECSREKQKEWDKNYKTKIK